MKRRERRFCDVGLPTSSSMIGKRLFCVLTHSSVRLKHANRQVMEISATCLECGTVGKAGETCETYFHQMLFWESEYPAYGAEVHHLMVLCYYLQHPSLYSPEGLNEAHRLLVEFVEHGASPAEVRKRNWARVDSSKRDWKIKATVTSHGSYNREMAWPMTAADVVAGGADHYCDNVRRWAQLINEALKTLQ
jgi:hypothetical protein